MRQEKRKNVFLGLAPKRCLRVLFHEKTCFHIPKGVFTGFQILIFKCKTGVHSCSSNLQMLIWIGNYFLLFHSWMLMFSFGFQVDLCDGLTINDVTSLWRG